MQPSKLPECKGCNGQFFSVPKPFGDHSLNIVKFCSRRRCTAEFLALSRQNSECQNQNFGWAVTCHGPCQIKWNTTVMVMRPDYCQLLIVTQNYLRLLAFPNYLQLPFLGRFLGDSARITSQLFLINYVLDTYLAAIHPLFIHTSYSS